MCAFRLPVRDHLTAEHLPRIYAKAHLDLNGAWVDSYSRGENYLFYPNEEIIRFASNMMAKTGRSQQILQQRATSAIVLRDG